MDIKGSVGPREIKSVHQLLCTPPWSLQLPTTYAVQLLDAKSVCPSGAAVSVVSLLIDAVKRKVLHRG